MSELARLRYTGDQPATFHHPGVGYVEPGGEFSVPEAEAERFTRRADIERADGQPDDAPGASDGSGTSGKPRGGKRGAGPSAQDAQG